MTSCPNNVTGWDIISMWFWCVISKWFSTLTHCCISWDSSYMIWNVLKEHSKWKVYLMDLDSVFKIHRISLTKIAIEWQNFSAMCYKRVLFKMNIISCACWIYMKKKTEVLFLFWNSTFSYSCNDVLSVYHTENLQSRAKTLWIHIYSEGICNYLY